MTVCTPAGSLTRDAGVRITRGTDRTRVCPCLHLPQLRTALRCSRVCLSRFALVPSQ